MGRTGIKVIPNKVFYQMWKEAQNAETMEDYIEAMTSFQSDKQIRLDKYNISYDETYILLKNIYEAYCLSFRDILEKADLKKSQASYEFCIPIRTIEDWYSGKNKCPSYIRFSIIRAYRLLDLGKYIYLESEIEYLNRKKPVYNKRDKTEKPIKQFAKGTNSQPVGLNRSDKSKPDALADGYGNNKQNYHSHYLDNDEFDEFDDYDYRSLNAMYSESVSHVSYAELQRRMKSYSEKSKEQTTEYAYDDYLRRKREKDNK